MTSTISRLRAAMTLALATLAITAAPAVAASGSTKLALDPAAAEALTGLGVTPAPIAPARATSDGRIAFPITNGFRSYLRTGKIRHRGGISLTAGETTVALKRFVVEPFTGVLTARVGNARLPILSLGLAGAQPALNSGMWHVDGITASLTATAADALNGAFGLAPGTVPAGLPLGTLTVGYRAFKG
jgi:hypothetical protein